MPHDLYSKGLVHRRLVRPVHVHQCACTHDCTVCTDSQPSFAHPTICLKSPVSRRMMGGIASSPEAKQAPSTVNTQHKF